MPTDLERRLADAEAAVIEAARRLAEAVDKLEELELEELEASDG
jgi:hypothetical protein